MKVMLDECLPRRLLRDLTEHMVTTVPRMRWNGLEDGPWRLATQTEFDVFVTMDTNLVYQQNLTGTSFCIIVLHAPCNRYEGLVPLIPDLRSALSSPRPGQIVQLGGA